MNERIKVRMTELKLNNKTFAKMLNISEAHLSMILSGKRNVSVQVLKSISEKLNLSIDYLIYGKETVND